MVNASPQEEGELLRGNDALQYRCESALHCLSTDLMDDIKKSDKRSWAVFFGRRTIKSRVISAQV